MLDDDWIDDFIQEVRKLAYDMPAPNPYTPMLLSHCLDAERRRSGQKCEIEDARFRSLCSWLTRPLP
jgi:hypothetical protein